MKTSSPCCPSLPFVSSHNLCALFLSHLPTFASFICLLLLRFTFFDDLQVVSRMADNALAAFAKILVDVHNANKNGVLSQ